MTIKEAKVQGKKDLTGNWGTVILGLILMGLIEGVAACLGGIVLVLLATLFNIGVVAFIRFMTKKGKADIVDLFYGFKDGIGNRIVLSLLKDIFVFLWSLLFVIPGIVKAYAYELADYVSMADPEKTFDQCISESKLKMNGHKGQLFLFDLSFIGWFLLTGLTCGLLWFYVGPYYTAARVEFLSSIAEEAGITLPNE